MVGRDPVIREWMQKFVCARVIQANAMDLSLFQFDYDMSFSVTFLHADRTVYARYGSRRGNEEKADQDLSMENLKAAMEGVLSLHEDYPKNKASLEGKQPRRPVPYAVPEEHPLLTKYTSRLNYEDKVSKSCVHCHMVRDSERRSLREKDEVLPRKLLTPYPMPADIGFELDVKTHSTVASVVDGSPAAKAGLAKGDVIQTIQGQAILSLADIQWVLHHTPETASLAFEITRGESAKELTIQLGAGWDHTSDIAWRVSTWDLRRMAFGGMRLVRLSDEERKTHGIESGKMALLAKNVGKYGDHAVARKAGARVGDIIVAFDEQQEDLTEGEIIKRVLGRRKRGDQVSFTYLRKGNKRTTSIKLQ